MVYPCTVGGFLRQDTEGILYTEGFLHMGKQINDSEKNISMR